MELRHYAPDPLGFDRHRTYEQTERTRHFKPVGFWVSVLGEDDWPSWNRAEEFLDIDSFVEHEVRLTERANVRLIQGEEEFLAFDREYVDKGYWDGRLRWIDWARVVEDYDGVIIAPYLWSQRLGRSPWYYGWDCASGCIWNLSAIESVTPVARPSEYVALNAIVAEARASVAPTGGDE